MRPKQNNKAMILDKENAEQIINRVERLLAGLGIKPLPDILLRVRYAVIGEPPEGADEYMEKLKNEVSRIQAMKAPPAEWEGVPVDMGKVPPGLFEYMSLMDSDGLTEILPAKNDEDYFSNMACMGIVERTELTEGKRTVFCQPIEPAKGSIIHTLLKSENREVMTSVFVPGIDFQATEKPGGWSEDEDPSGWLIPWSEVR